MTKEEKWSACGRPLEEQLLKATLRLTKLKVKYRELRRFLESKGVPATYFEEWNARFNADYKPDREFMVHGMPTWRDAHTDPPRHDRQVRVATANGSLHYLRYSCGHWNCTEEQEAQLTYWLDCPPLPPLPRGRR